MHELEDRSADHLIGAVLQHFGRAEVHVGGARVGVEQPDALVRRLDDASVRVFSLRQRLSARVSLDLTEDAAGYAGEHVALDLTHGEIGETGEHFDALRCDVWMRDRVHDRQGAENEAVTRTQRCAGVEADPGFAGDDRVVPKAPIAAHVGDCQYAGSADDRCAKGVLQRSFGDGQAQPRLEPFSMVVDERDDGNRNVEQGSRNFDDIVESGFRQRVEDFVPPQRCEARISPRCLAHVCFGTCRLMVSAVLSRRKRLFRATL
jgi:hypothetical protein